MPGVAVEVSSLRAVALKHTRLTDFAVRPALRAAEHPPAPNAKLLAAARSLPRRP